MYTTRSNIALKTDMENINDAHYSSGDVKTWRTIHSDTVFASKYVTVKCDEVEFEDGLRIPDFYTIRIPDAACICAITEDVRVLLKREYRYACQEALIELPAGQFEKNENPLDVAKRELLEETGYISDCWIYLGATRESTSKLTNTMHLFMATGCKLIAKQHLDKTERLEAWGVPLDEAVDMVMQNEIKSNSSAQAILMASRLYYK